MLEDDEEKEIGVKKKNNTRLLKKWHKNSNVDCFISKIEKPLYDEPNVL
jgi:hypothetical protein